MSGRQQRKSTNNLRVLVLKRNFRIFRNNLANEQPEEYRKQLLREKTVEKQTQIQNQQHPNKKFKIIHGNKEIQVAKENEDLNSSNLSVINFSQRSQQLLRDLNESIASAESVGIPCYKHIFSLLVKKFKV